MIDSKMVEYISGLSKLNFDKQETIELIQDMEQMLSYIDCLKEINVKSVEPISHIFDVSNVFREDEISEVDGADDLLKNAPHIYGRNLVVPKTVE